MSKAIIFMTRYVEHAQGAPSNQRGKCGATDEAERRPELAHRGAFTARLMPRNAS